MLPIILTTGPLADFCTGIVLGAITFGIVNGGRNPLKIKK